MASPPNRSEAASRTTTGLPTPSPDKVQAELFQRKSTPQNGEGLDVGPHYTQTAPAANMSGAHHEPLSTSSQLRSMSAAQLQAGLELAGYACVARSVSCGCGSEVWGLEHLCRHAEIRHHLEYIDEIALNYSHVLHPTGQNVSGGCIIKCLHCDWSGDVRSYPRHAITHDSPERPASLIPAGRSVGSKELPFSGPQIGTPSSALPGMYDTDRDDNWVIFTMHANLVALDDYSLSANTSSGKSNILPRISYLRQNVTNLPPIDDLDLIPGRDFAAYHEQHSRERGLAGTVHLGRPLEWLRRVLFQPL